MFHFYLRYSVISFSHFTACLASFLAFFKSINLKVETINPQGRSLGKYEQRVNA
jgi:hypothetical protein